MSDHILFVNSRQPACGVHQFFKRLCTPVVNSNPIKYFYIDVDNESEHDYWIAQLNPSAVLYNFYFSGVTMNWLTNDKINTQKNKFKQLCIHHEGSVLDKGFDVVLHQDPFNTDPRYYNLSRPIPEYNTFWSSRSGNASPIIGSFGFGLGGKGFGRLVETVCREFKQAHIRINIPFAYFGDANGNGARWWADHCRNLLNMHNQGNITLEVTHDLLPEKELLNWLAMNDINCFLYDNNGGRGISGTTDYALAVRKPIAITKSDQFKHLWMLDDSFTVEEHSLQEIISRGINHLEKYHELWNTQTLIQDFERLFERN